MKAFVFERYGPPEVLQLKEVPKPKPKDHEVLVRVHATTVIAGDCELRKFEFPLWFWLPFRLYIGLTRPKRVTIIGQELAGTIEAVGKDVTRFEVGQEVFAPTSVAFGAYAEYVCLSSNKAMAAKSAAMSFGEAAALCTGGLNALHYTRKAQIQPGDKVLINGACGNIGSYAVQLAKVFGAEVTAVDTSEKLEALRSMGADHVMDYQCTDFTKTGQVYDVVFDVVGKTPYSRTLKCLSETGRYVIANPRLTAMVRGTWSSMIGSKKVRFQFADYRSEDLVFLRDLVDSGKLRPVIDRTYRFEDMVEAHRYVDQGRIKGNVVVTLD